MRVVFLGAVEFSRQCLATLFAQRANVVGVFCPHRQAARNSDYADLAPTALANGVPCYSFRRVGDRETIELIRSLQPDVILVFGLSQIIPSEVLGIPKLGCIGSHPALLPYNRGRHPLIWTLIENLSEGGLTFFYLDEGVDSGDILWQRAFTIRSDDDATVLYRKVTDLATDAIAEFLPRLEAGNAPRLAQDHSKATYWRKRTESDGEIDWLQPAERIHNLVRALTHPYPGAHSYLDGRLARIWRTRVTASQGNPSAAPGVVIARTTGGVSIQCGDAPLDLLSWECFEGDALKPGIRLESLNEVHRDS